MPSLPRSSLLLVFLICSAGLILVWATLTPSSRESRTKSSVKAPLPVSSPQATEGVSEASTASMESSPIRFTDVIDSSGIDFTYYGGPSADGNMIEQNGGGVGLLDFDGDGILDIFLANGSRFDKPAAGLGQSSRLYRAVSDTLRYADATVPAGLETYGFGQGCAAGDFDNDGFTDLFLACYGRNRLWRNNGDGTFTESTDNSSRGTEFWSTSAAFADLNADGLLDLYVANYVDWSPAEAPCFSNGHPELNLICSPVHFSGQPDLLYENQGDGTFRETGQAAGIAIPERGKGMALAIADFNGDARPDIYVANDTTNNSLFLNRGAMHFEEAAVRSGVAISSTGVIGASMGVGVADFDNNGFLDIFTTNFENQVNDLYANTGTAGFIAENTSTGLDLFTRSPLGFGVAFSDFDCDGWPDLFVANGHIWNQKSLGPQFEFEMFPSLFRNESGRRFQTISTGAGEYFQHRGLGRAVAYGDLDNDGDTDLVVSDAISRPAILRNDSIRSRCSVRLRLIGTTASRSETGASASVNNPARHLYWVPSGGSFQASCDFRLIFNRSGSDSEMKVSMTWTDGMSDSIEIPETSTSATLIQNAGLVWPSQKQQ